MRPNSISLLNLANDWSLFSETDTIILQVTGPIVLNLLGANL